MRQLLKIALSACLTLYIASAQKAHASEKASEPKAAPENAQFFDDDDRLSVLAAALDRHVRRTSERDCSHLVHAIYEHAGFPYAYAPSDDIYAGIDGFERVKQPEAGDLIVWRGHVGIVVKPSTHIFFSFMSSGPGTDDYEAPYWKHRGKPRFYRYLKNFCQDCDDEKRQSHRLLTIRRSKER